MLKIIIFKKFVLYTLNHYPYMLTFLSFLLSNIVIIIIFDNNQILDHLKVSIEFFVYKS